MVLVPLVEYGQRQSSLDNQTNASLANTNEIIRPSAPNIKQVTTDYTSNTPRGILYTSDTELDMLILDTGCGKNNGIIVSEDTLTIPCPPALAGEGDERAVASGFGVP